MKLEINHEARFGAKQKGRGGITMRNMQELSLREKIGQMVMCGFHGTEPSENIQRLIREHHIGGVIYFRRNVQDVAQICRLSADLQDTAQSSSTFPLLIAIDQEGGMVARIDEGVTPIPGNMALGATRNVQGAYEAAKISGTELRLMGINMNFAPCVDVNNNPGNPVIGVRSFGEDPALVSDMGAAAVKGYQEAGVAATVKHFPGHGDTELDSHLDLPSIPHDRERLYRVELVPFIRAVEEGVDAIMTAHVVFPAFEPELVPATLSRRVISQLLREELKYEGVIVTDCLEMNAISEVYGVGVGAVMAVAAGADIVLVSHELDRQLSAIESLVKAVETGRIPMERIDSAVARILALKERRGIGEPGVSAGEAAKLMRQPPALETARRLSEQSITLVRDDAGQLPLDVGAKTLVIWPEMRQITPVDEMIRHEFTLGEALTEFFGNKEEVKVANNPAPDQIQRIVEQSANFAQIIFISYNAVNSPWQQELLHALASVQSAALVVAAVRNPYDLLCMPEVKTYLACYENRPEAMRSLAKILAGKLQPSGKLPVTINAQYPYGWSV